MEKRINKNARTAITLGRRITSKDNIGTAMKEFRFNSLKLKVIMRDKLISGMKKIRFL